MNAATGFAQRINIQGDYFAAGIVPRKGVDRNRMRSLLTTLGVIIGVAQTMGAAINPEWQILSGHIAFLIVLLIRPRGLFPRAVD